MIILGYVGSLGYGALCLVLSLLAYKLGLPKRYTRKIVHILVGAEWLILYHTLGVSIHFVAVCLIFTALLAIAYKKNLMTMISSDSDNAPGTVYYGISMTVMAILSLFLENYVFAFGIAVFCTSLGDGLAGVIGSAAQRYNVKVYKNKSLLGTLSAFVFSFLSAMLFSEVYKLELGVWYALAIAAFAAGLELLAERGLDNITLPLGTSAFVYALLYVEGASDYIAPIILTPFVIAFALSGEVLTKRGVLSAIVLDVSVSVALGNFGFVLLLSFLMLSVAIDKIKKHLQKNSNSIEKRGDKRDGVQVMANGTVPMILALLYLLTENFIFVIGYNAALAECFADTSASGIGVLSRTAFDPFRMKKVPVGLSGGMSLLGTAASLLAPFVFLLISVAFGILDLKAWLICSASAFIGAVFDSLCGSLLQVKYKCCVCGKTVEREEHCGERTAIVSGFKFITNDAVNVVSVIFASVLAIFLYILL